MPAEFHKCPECEGTILDRTAERCIYCGAPLPSELLLPAEESASLEQAQKENKNSNDPPQSDDGSDIVEGAADVIDILSDLGDLFD